MFRFTIRDLLWLTVLVGGVAWSAEHFKRLDADAAPARYTGRQGSDYVLLFTANAFRSGDTSGGGNGLISECQAALCPEAIRLRPWPVHRVGRTQSVLRKWRDDQLPVHRHA